MQIVEKAMAATGKSRQSIIFECIREAMPRVVRQYEKVQSEARQFFSAPAGKKAKK